MNRWPVALVGLALMVFGVVALSGPGRIDIEDGQARYEAGRNLIDHGDTILRDDRVFWNAFPGRGGAIYTGYRLPQIVVVAACVAVADATGPVEDARRHFAFSLHGAVCAAMLAVLYALWFRSRGLSERAALAWAALGIAATPLWYYGTSTFDEMLASLVAVAAVMTLARSKAHLLWLLASVPLMAVLYDCKPPLVALGLAGIGLAAQEQVRSKRVAVIAVAMAIGMIAGWKLTAVYQEYRFPPDARAEYDRILREQHIPMFLGCVPEAVLDIAIGPSSGVVWYFPPVVLCLAGVGRQPRPARLAILAAAVALVGFVSLLTFYKGGICWGPRYLVPLFAVLWLFAPAGVARLGAGWTRMLVVTGVVVQVLSLQAIPERLTVQRELPTAFYLDKPWWYLHPALGHVVNRPRETVEVWTAPAAPQLSPAPTPTFTLPIFDPPYFTESKGQAAVAKYQLLNGPRFWWAWMPHWPDCPVDVLRTVATLLIVTLLGGALIFGAWRRSLLSAQ